MNTKIWISQNLKTFSTLSPIPGFRSWLNSVISDGKFNLLKSSELKALNLAMGRAGGAVDGLKEALSNDNWFADTNLSNALQGPLMRLAAQYIIVEKVKDDRARDMVAHFHLSNGAIVERLNWMGDTSENGMKQSAGLMINYLYNLDRIEDNHEAYSSSHQVKTSSYINNI